MDTGEFKIAIERVLKIRSRQEKEGILYSGNFCMLKKNSKRKDFVDCFSERQMEAVFRGSVDEYEVKLYIYYISQTIGTQLFSLEFLEVPNRIGPETYRNVFSGIEGLTPKIVVTDVYSKDGPFVQSWLITMN